MCFQIMEAGSSAEVNRETFGGSEGVCIYPQKVVFMVGNKVWKRFRIAYE